MIDPCSSWWIPSSFPLPASARTRPFNLDSRTAGFHYWATGITPAMFAKTVGLGSQYAAAFTDSFHHALDGSKAYKVHLPPHIPAKDNWSFTRYDNPVTRHDNQTRSNLQTLTNASPSVNSSTRGPQTNPDGSTDVWFAAKPAAGSTRSELGPDHPGQRLEHALPPYGPLGPWFEKTWRVGEVELVK